jgi:hypothetical protein
MIFVCIVLVLSPGLPGRYSYSNAFSSFENSSSTSTVLRTEYEYESEDEQQDEDNDEDDGTRELDFVIFVNQWRFYP